MTKVGHLWAVGYGEMGRAAEVRDEITRLADRHCLVLLDVAVGVRYPDGAVTLYGEPLLAPTKIRGRGFASFPARPAPGPPPLTRAAVVPLPPRTRAPSVGISAD